MRGHCAATRDSALHRATDAMNQHQRAALLANLPITGGMAHNVAVLIGWSIHVFERFLCCGCWVVNYGSARLAFGRLLVLF